VGRVGAADATVFPDGGGGGGVRGTFRGLIVGVPVVAGVGDAGMVSLPGGGGCLEVELADPGRTAGFEFAIDGLVLSANPLFLPLALSMVSLAGVHSIRASRNRVGTHPCVLGCVPLTHQDGRLRRLAQRPRRAKRCAQHDGLQIMDDERLRLLMRFEARTFVKNQRLSFRICQVKVVKASNVFESHVSCLDSRTSNTT
jgi:hypothetical protein